MPITKVKFKKPDTTLSVAGQVYNDGNITPEAYIHLYKINPAFGELFSVESEEDATLTEHGEDEQDN